jgi:hypothetical protein
MGLEDFGHSRVWVSGSVLFTGNARLVLQLYGASSQGAARATLPVGAVQRVVTAAELHKGIDISLPHQTDVTEGCTILAWLEPDGAELEFGALTAKPSAPLASASGRIRQQHADIHFAAARIEAAAA